MAETARNLLDEEDRPGLRQRIAEGDLALDLMDPSPEVPPSRIGLGRAHHCLVLRAELLPSTRQIAQVRLCRPHVIQQRLAAPKGDLNG